MRKYAEEIGTDRAIGGGTIWSLRLSVPFAFVCTTCFFQQPFQSLALSIRSQTRRSIDSNTKILEDKFNDPPGESSRSRQGMSNKGGVPDAWDDDWMNLADV